MDDRLYRSLLMVGIGFGFFKGHVFLSGLWWHTGGHFQDLIVQKINFIKATTMGGCMSQQFFLALFLSGCVREKHIPILKILQILPDLPYMLFTSVQHGSSSIFKALGGWMRVRVFSVLD